MVVYSPLGLLQYAMLADVKAAGTSGGTFTSGADRTRTLNTVVYDSIGVSLNTGTNQLTLPTGVYTFKIACPAFRVDRHKAHLYNITDTVITQIGSSEVSLSASGGNAQTCSVIVGRMILTAQKTFEIRHRCQTTLASSGFGVESNFGVDEYYTIAEFWRYKV